MLECSAVAVHAVLAALIPGGMGKELVPRQASQLLRRVRLVSMVEAERKRITHELLATVRRLERELATSKARLRGAVQAADTSLSDIYGSRRCGCWAADRGNLPKKRVSPYPPLSARVMGAVQLVEI